MNVLPDYARRVGEMRMHTGLVRDLFRIAEVGMDESSETRLRGRSDNPLYGTSTRFYAAGEFVFTDGITPVGVLLCEQPRARFMMYAAGSALIYDVFDGRLPVSTYRVLGLLGNDAGLVLEDFGYTDATLDRTNQEVDALFSDTDGFYFSKDGHLVAGDFDKAFPSKEHERRYYELYSAVQSKMDEFTIKHP